MHEIDQDLINRGLMEIIDTPHNRQLAEVHEQQGLIDALGVGVLNGDIQMQVAKQAVETEDWEAARSLVGSKRPLGALELADCRICDRRRIFVRTRNGSSYRWTCERCGTDMEEKDNG
jgi:PHP family Zn ribbon phosphoesterase